MWLHLLCFNLQINFMKVLYEKERVNLRDSAGIPLYIGLCFGYAFSTFYSPVDYPRTASHEIGRCITFSYELILLYKRGHVLYLHLHNPYRGYDYELPYHPVACTRSFL